MTRTKTSTPATRIRSALTARGLSYSAAGELAGCNKSYVSDLCNGRRVATLDWLHAAAVAWGVDPAELDERLASRAGE